MSIVTNIGTYSSSKITEKDYEKMTSLSVIEKNTIKVDLSKLGMYRYMKQFLLFYINNCKKLYLSKKYIFTPLHI